MWPPHVRQTIAQGSVGIYGSTATHDSVSVPLRECRSRSQCTINGQCSAAQPMPPQRCVLRGPSASRTHWDRSLSCRCKMVARVAPNVQDMQIADPLERFQRFHHCRVAPNCRCYRQTPPAPAQPRTADWDWNGWEEPWSRKPPGAPLARPRDPSHGEEHGEGCCVSDVVYKKLFGL